MSVLLAVDPGVHKHACAWFSGPHLYYLSFVPTNQRWTATFLPDRFVVEEMRFTPNDKALKGTAQQIVARLNDVMNVARAADRLAGMLEQAGGPRPVRYPPAEWKQQQVKVKHHFKIWGALTEAERAVVSKSIGYDIKAIEAKFEKVLHTLAQTGEVKGYEWAAHNLFDAIGLGLFDLKTRRLR